METDPSFASCLDKQAQVKSLFAGCTSPDRLYQVMIELGRKLPPFPPELKEESNKVFGCQSEMYLACVQKQDKLYFYADSEALISKGLAALLIEVYSGESAETILKCPPTFLNELQLPSLLSPSRSNGLSSLFLHMKKCALKQLL